MKKFSYVCLVVYLLSPLGEALPAINKEQQTETQRHNKSKCQCINEHFHEEDESTGLIQGTYSYLDPLGQNVTVHYEHNGEEAGYKENRTVTKQDKTEVEILVHEILEAVESDIAELIKNTIEESDNADARSIVLQIQSSLTPILTREVNAALDKHQTDLDVDNLVAMIIKKLVPVISETVSRQTGEAIIFPGETEEEEEEEIDGEELVKGIVQELKAVVEISIDETFSEMKGDSEDKKNPKSETLVQKIVSKLKPIVAGTVQSENNENESKPESHESENQEDSNDDESINQKSNNQESDEEDSEEEADEEAKEKLEDEEFYNAVVEELQDDIDDKVDEIVRPRPHFDHNYQVSKILQSLSEDIQKAVRKQLRQDNIYVASEFFTNPAYNVFLEKLLSEIKPKVQQKVEELSEKVIEEQNERILSDKFVDKVVKKMEIQVAYKIHKAMKDFPESAKTEEIVESVVSNIEPVLLQGVRAVISKQRIVVAPDFYQSETFDQLVEKLVEKLTPIIEKAVEDEKKEEEVQFRNRDELEDALLNDEFVNEVVGNVTEEYKEEIHRNLKALINGNRDDEEIVDEIVQEMEFLLIRKLVRAVKQEMPDVEKSFFRSKTFYTFVENCVTRFKASIRNEMTKLEKEQEVQSQIVEQVVEEIEPLVPGSVRAVIKIYGTEKEDQLAEKVLEGLKSIVDKSVKQKLIRQTGPSDEEDVKDLTEQILFELRPFVIETIQEELGQTSEKNNEESEEHNNEEYERVINEAIRRLRSTIRSYTRTVVRMSSGRATEDEMIDQVLEYIQPTTESTISFLVRQYPSVAEKEEQLMEDVVSECREIIKEHIEVEIEKKNQDDNNIRRSLQHSATSYKQKTSGSPQQTSGSYQPKAPRYHQQQATKYHQPQASGYRHQQASGYRHQQASGYRQPQTSNYHQPQASNYHQPQSAGYRQPQASVYHQQASGSSNRHQSSGSQKQSSGMAGMNGMGGGFVTFQSPTHSYGYSVDK